MSCRSVPVAGEGGIETRITPILVVVVFVAGRRMAGAHKPARFGGAGIGIRLEAQEQRAHTVLRAGECKPPARHEIEALWRARNFDHHCAERGTGERIGCRAQSARHIGGTKEKKPRRVDAEFQKAGGRYFAEFEA